MLRSIVIAVVAASAFSSAAIAAPIGTLLNTIDISSFSTSPVGLENDGSGNLLLTDIGTDSVLKIDTNGNLIGAPVALTGTDTNPIGITTDGAFWYVTNTNNTTLDTFQTDGAFVSSFSVAGETTFPEGVTFNATTGNLVVISGSSNNIAAEYTTSGTLLNTYAIAGSSQDGVAYDSVLNAYWVLDSGTSFARLYDASFNELMNFDLGFSGAEGVALVGESLFAVFTGQSVIREYSVFTAVSEPATIALLGLTLVGFVRLARRNK